MTEPAGSAAPSRYFLALLPDEQARSRLAAQCQPGDGRCVLPADLHLTLAFLGDLRAPDAHGLIAAVEPLCRRGAVPVFLDRIEAWRGPRALCAVGDMPGVAALAESLWGGLLGLGYHRDTRPFRGHVTLARNLPAATCRQPARRLEPPVCWSARALCLMASQPRGAAPGQPRYATHAVLDFTP
ncbi:MAG: hypothetical protein RLZZ200_2856 [Pseudomonadota bacterium]|jgi:2'-5' RNA ligase